MEVPACWLTVTADGPGMALVQEVSSLEREVRVGRPTQTKNAAYMGSKRSSVPTHLPLSPVVSRQPQAGVTICSTCNGQHPDV